MKRVDVNFTMPFKQSTVIQFINRMKANDAQIPLSSHKGGSESKITDEIANCLITTTIDFPQWSSKQRKDYLESPNGPCYGENTVKLSIRTINNYLSKHKISYKKLAFSPPARNTFGAVLSRAIWSYFVDELRKEKVLFVFLDESSITSHTTKGYGRGVIGVTPILNQNINLYTISLLAAIIP